MRWTVAFPMFPADHLVPMARRAEEVGFDSITVPDSVFDRAHAILDAYRAATEATDGERKGAVMFGDEMIDEASRKMAVKFVSRGERAGLQRSSE